MNIKFVVAGEFDLDKGAAVREYYPAVPEPLFKHENGFGELLIPDRAHLRDEDRTCFPLYHSPKRGFTYTPHDSDAVKYYVLNIIRSQIDSELKRGARIFSIAVVTPEPWYAVLRPVVVAALDAYMRAPHLDVLKDLFDALEGIDMGGLPQFSHPEKRLLQMNQQQSLFRDFYMTKYNGVYGQNTSTKALSDTHFYDVVAKFRSLDIPIKVPTDVADFNAGDFSVSDFVRFVASLGSPQGFHKEINVYGPNTPALVALWCSMLTGKRVLIVGTRKTPAHELCSLVLACGFLGAAGGTVDTSNVVYPYLELGRMEEVAAHERGYVGGTTNPAILLHPEWWDVAVHIETRHFEISSKRRRPPPARFPELVTRDKEVQVDLRDMLLANATERAIRERIIFYGTKFSRSVAADDLAKVAASIAESPNMFVPGVGPFWAVPGEQAQFESTFLSIARKWHSMPSYKHFLDMNRQFSWPNTHKVIIDLRHHYDRLRLGQLSVRGAAETYKLLTSTIKDSSDVTQFLAANNSIYYLMHGLYHPDKEIREQVAQLVLRIKRHTAGKFYFLALSPFHSIGLESALAETEQV